ncbi:alcohol dehydrogenase [Burkholderia sp. WAC0059]|uniref:alcohol dehydrogenase catalytic domain-containing protein n=1 Tax=Burkholderia sp. WAC0059 TaxID=2066022 RepID=UPI000C7EA244|nr:zinc-binding dehydrogenase [Burkholderia sp. WAC0059]PLZ00718.1 alcohol dehydrogenase [Burkholderia sp. WAC0059]
MSGSTNLLRRIVQYRFGDPRAVLQVEDDISEPPLSDGEVRVRVTRSIIHPGDLQLVEARYSQSASPIPFGRVPGLEAAGVVEDAAPHALDGTGITVGSRVAFFAPGAWQSRAVVPAGSLVAVPDDLPDSVATQILINTITARHVLRAGQRALSATPRRIVQTGAASAVGKLITAFALKDGLAPIRLVRSPESARHLAAVLPGGDIVDTSSGGWQDAVRKAAGGDIPVVFDGLGGSLIGDIAALLNMGGTVVSYGALAGRMADLNLFVPRALTLRSVTLGTWRNDTTPEEHGEDMAEAIRIARAVPRIYAGYREFDLADLDTAIDAVSAPGKTGNVILKF